MRQKVATVSDKGATKKKKMQEDRQAGSPSVRAGQKKEYKKKRNLHMKMAHKRGLKGGGGEWPRDKNENKA